jgi:hypothetical protein
MEILSNMKNNLFETASIKETPVRINRLVSVILNGVAINKLAVNNDHNVDAMTDSLINNLSGTVQRNIRTQEFRQLKQTLSAELSQRMSANLE